MKATLLDDRYVCVEWLTNKIGYLSKTVVKDLHRLEDFIKRKHFKGWVLGSEVENTGMHKLIVRFGGVYEQEFDGLKIFRKEVR